MDLTRDKLRLPVEVLAHSFAWLDEPDMFVLRTISKSCHSAVSLHMEMILSRRTVGGLVRPAVQATSRRLLVVSLPFMPSEVLQSVHQLQLHNCVGVSEREISLMGACLEGLREFSAPSSLQSLEGWSTLLTAFPSLTSLDVSSYTHLTEECIRILVRFAGLKSLTLPQFHRLEASDAQVIANSLFSLESFTLSSSELRDDALGELLMLTKLRTLNLQGCKQMTNSNVCQIARLISLTSLNLAKCEHLTDIGLIAIGENLTSLTSFSVGWCPRITDAGAAHIVKLPQLAALSMCGCNHITDLTLEKIPNDSQLRSLDMDWCPITANGFQHFAKVPNLESVRLTWNYSVADVGLLALGKATSLTSLSLGMCNRLSVEGVRGLANLMSLKCLDLSFCSQFNDQSALELVPLRSLTSLLLTGSEQLTDVGVTTIARHFLQLVVLGLSQCKRITDVGVLELAAHLQSLQVLHISGCGNITDTAARAIVKLPCFKTLTAIDCVQITDSCRQQLKSILQSRSE